MFSLEGWRVDFAASGIVRALYSTLEYSSDRIYISSFLFFVDNTYIL